MTFSAADDNFFQLLPLEHCDVLEVQVDFGLLLERNRVLAKALEGLDLTLVLVDVAVVQVDVLGREDAG